MRLLVTIGDKSHDLELAQTADAWECRIDGRTVKIDVAVLSPGVLSIVRDGRSYVVRQGATGVRVGENSYQVSITDPRSWRARQMTSAASGGPQRVTASMPGRVVRVLTTVGTQVKAGQGIVVIEAMKMQNELRSPRDGTIREIMVSEGSAISAGDVVAVVE